MKKPFFICFEGVEGSGKSTQAKLLYKFIKNNITKKVILTREPGGTAFAEKIRNILLDSKIKNSPLTEFFLLMAARNDHVVNKINYYLYIIFICIYRNEIFFMFLLLSLYNFYLYIFNTS